VSDSHNNFGKDAPAFMWERNCLSPWVHVKVVGKNKSFKEREKDGILFGETKV